MSGTGIRELSLVIVPVTDQDRSIDFYVDSLGLEKRTDTPFGNGYRWVEVYAPEGTTGIALATPPPGTDATPQQTGITLTSQDIDSTHAEMLGRAASTSMRRSPAWAARCRRCSGSVIPTATR